jgi:hypothetical protein
MNKIHSPVQALVRGTQILIDGIPKPEFFTSGVLNVCKYIKSKNIIIFTITLFSNIYYAFVFRDAEDMEMNQISR